MHEVPIRRFEHRRRLPALAARHLQSERSTYVDASRARLAARGVRRPRTRQRRRASLCATDSTQPRAPKPATRDARMKRDWIIRLIVARRSAAADHLDRTQYVLGRSVCSLPLQGRSRHESVLCRDNASPRRSARRPNGATLGHSARGDAIIVLSIWHWRSDRDPPHAIEAWVESGGRLVLGPPLIGGDDELERWSRHRTRVPATTTMNRRRDRCDDATDNEGRRARCRPVGTTSSVNQRRARPESRTHMLRRLHASTATAGSRATAQPHGRCDDDERACRPCAWRSVAAASR